MKNLFEQSRSHWVRYDHYELKTAEDGKRYITPGKNAKPDVYNPLKEIPNIVLDALNVGMLLMGRKPEAEVEKAVMEFVTRYGLLGLMTALPTTPTFMDYEAVYLPKNHFIKEELNIPSEMVLSDRADGACRPQKWCSAAVCMVHSYGFR